jgi:two-component system, LuxR family, sensor kinase FixL
MSAYRPVEEELHALLDAAVEGIVVIDHLGRIQAFNRSAERLFGYQAREVLDRNVNVLMNEPDCIAHDGHLARYAATRVARIIGNGREVSARRKDGSVFPAFLLVRAVADSEPPRFVGFVHDMTPRRQGEEHARRLQERLWHVSRLATVGEMASGIAHELNQPLAAIANYAHACDRLLGRPDADLEEVRGALKQIAAQAVRAGDIIRRLRSLAQPHVDRREPTEINVLITELTALVRSDAQAHDVQYRLELSDGLPPLEVHRTQIQHVILNLVRNAIESLAETPDKPREIVVRTSRTRDGEVEVSVCDSGPGVPSSVAPHLFDPFWTSKPAGAGLGLAISRTLIAEHGGTLDYRPNLPVGACFALRLPVVNRGDQT